MGLEVLRQTLQLLALPGAEKWECIPEINDEVLLIFSDADGSCSCARDFLLTAAEDVILGVLQANDCHPPRVPPLSNNQDESLDKLYLLMYDYAEGSVPDEEVMDASSQWWQRIESQATLCLGAFGWPRCGDPRAVADRVFTHFQHD